ncbi:glycoside hydrolase family 2 TIM barrel-domain containing protein [Paenibacillus sp. LHD-38]|uniref:glycoside hydrolase family 2 protein n=1 Tax=Paenibacillus sp. LHD-38 TaxID=3072143 RepID=UPI00280F58C5|nr:glycoside hydrolase family 2 TIM barrel-domain containing protein [Paenibacillus sp. LHD-38]MDQ8737113.1 glycoside hydrolase family 2 TIM barrel-domain containing protein [Paenibacillus sp. LHD-38]
MECTVPGIACDMYTARTGFREAVVKEDGFYLNGRTLKLRGLNRHQSFPYVGYAMPERVQRKDADILKHELKLNVVRTSHYPQSRHFLDRCDEIGLLVFEEIPGWQHIGDDEWKKVACNHVREMIKRDWNHPSVFLWGVRINESGDDHDFYADTNRIARELDPSRQTAGVRCITNSEFLEDVYTMNDFIHTGAEIVLRDQKEVTELNRHVPYMVTEFNGHIYPTKRFDQEERLIEHAMRHLRVHNAAGIDEHISGAIGWCAFDYNTHHGFGSGERICYHGVMDMFRIPKFAAAFYRSQCNPEEEAVLEPMTLWTRGERSMGGIMPLTIFTNCDEVKLYVGGTYKGTFSAQQDQYPGVEYPPVVISNIEGEWGDRWYDGEFVGYVHGKEVIRRQFSRNPVPTQLTAEPDDLELDSTRPDATRIVYKLVDQTGNIISYIPEYIEFTISGPGEIIGPNRTALIGGCIAVWVRAQGKGEIMLSAQCSNLRVENIILQVR